MTTSTPKFQHDLAARLSEIAQDGATPALVTALMVAVRRVVEDTKTQETFKFACLFCTWSIHPTLDRIKTISKLLEGFNDIIVTCLQGNFTGMLVPAISNKLRLEEFRLELLEICNFSNVDASPIKDDNLWGEIRHQLLSNLCEVPLSLPVKSNKCKTLIAKYPGATGIVSSILITPKSGSPVMKEHSYYWRTYVIDPSDLDAAPRCIVGAVML